MIETHYAVLGCFTKLESGTGEPMSVDKKSGLEGFMPIYKKREAAEKLADGKYQVLEMQIVKNDD